MKPIIFGSPTPSSLTQNDVYIKVVKPNERRHKLYNSFG